MTFASVPQSNPNDELTADLINRGPNAVAAVVNGNLDDSNISQLSGTKITSGTLPVSAFPSTQDDLIPADGWVPANETWTYVSATTFTVPGDQTTKYGQGVRLKFTQSATVKYAIVRTSTYSAPNTTVQILASADSIANAAITSNFYSRVSNPQGVNIGGGWEEIGRTTLTVAGDTLRVENLPQRKYLRIIATYTSTGGNTNAVLTFNGDTGNNYAFRVSTNGAADVTSTSTNSIQIADTVADAGTKLVDVQVHNVQSIEKVVIGQTVSGVTSGAATAPSRRIGVGKWANTATIINRVDFVNGSTGDFAIGSEVIVLGRD